MIDYRNAFRLRWMPGLGALSGKPRMSLREWFDRGVYQVQSSGKRSQVLVTNIDNAEVMNCFAGDINRLGSAAFESLCNIQEYEGLPKSTAWPLVTLYYAALFYSHAVLRVMGVSPSYFNTSELIKLRAVAAAYGVLEASKFRSGLYTLSANPNLGEVAIIQENNSGGSHELMWKRYATEVGNSMRLLANSTFTASDKKSLALELELVQRAVSGASATGGRLSEIRNSIQYRQKFGVWFPYSGSLTVEKLRSRVAHSRTDDVKLSSFDIDNTDELVSFYESCCVLVAVGIGVLHDLRSVSTKSFLRYGLTYAENSLGA